MQFGGAAGIPDGAPIPHIPPNAIIYRYEGTTRVHQQQHADHNLLGRRLLPWITKREIRLIGNPNPPPNPHPSSRAPARLGPTRGVSIEPGEPCGSAPVCCGGRQWQAEACA